MNVMRAGMLVTVCVAMGLGGCKPTARDVIKLWDENGDRGAEAVIKKMMADERGWIEACGEAFAKNPNIMAGLIQGEGLKGTWSQRELAQAAAFFRAAAKSDPKWFTTLTKSFAANETDSKLDVDAELRIFPAVVEASEAGSAVGIQDVACSGVDALRTYSRSVFSAENWSEYEPHVLRVIKAKCSSPEGAASVLRGVLTDSSGTGLQVLKRYLNATRLLGGRLQFKDTGAIEEELRRRISDAEENAGHLAAARKWVDEYKKLKAERAKYQEISGRIVANLGDNSYEVSGVTWQKVIVAWYSYETYTHPKAILVTTSTKFESTGRFGMWAKNTGEREVELKNGFKKNWPVWEEASPPKDLDRELGVRREAYEGKEYEVRNCEGVDEYFKKHAANAVAPLLATLASWEPPK